jgi:hypothetical protein
MAQKNYNFNEILKEFNKIYSRGYVLPSEVGCVTIVHDLETGVFHVTYLEKGGIIKQKKSLHNFISRHISGDICWSNFDKIMFDKEDKKLKLKIEIWPPNKIRYAYLYFNYFADGVGNLGKSCMRNKSMQKALNFYVKNNVSIVVVIDDKNKIHARALLWDNVKSTKLKTPFTYLDRVYAKTDTLCSLFYDLAEENKWKRYPSTTVNQMNKSYYKKDIIVAGMCHLPYNDTFRYLYPKDNLLASSTGLKINKSSHLYTTLQEHTNCGYYPELDPDRTQEAITGAYISKKDATFIKRYEGNYDGFVLKKNIANINGVYYSIHDNEIIKTKLDGFILKENSVNEVISNDVINKTTAIHSPKYNGHIHESNAIVILDEIYHKKDTDVICFRDKWYHISQCFVNYDREKRNIALSKQKFHSWIENEVFVPYPDDFVVRKSGFIPKGQAIIAYNIVYNPVSDDIEYQEVYRTNMQFLIPLTTGELIVSSTENKKYLKKFNNKWYIKQSFKLPGKKQLTFSFMEK